MTRGLHCECEHALDVELEVQASRQPPPVALASATTFGVTTASPTAMQSTGTKPNTNFLRFFLDIIRCFHLPVTTANTRYSSNDPIHSSCFT